ncbi:hypothetical protein [Kitasatospora sp. NPDC051914]|uniref:hypothetical protein n=1 Tax=Kitasatospora sp. NPDC051914 TaxID=3154945 RepID=UPI0034461075
MSKLTEEQRQQRAAARAHREALAAEEDHRRREERSERWSREGVYLSWEEFRRGEPCRGCGDPMSDGLGDWPALLRMTEQERQERDLAEMRFKERHGGCREGRWTVSGSRVLHCFACCPFPPMSPEQARVVGKILFAPRSENHEKELDAWKLTLTCDHVVEKTAHRSNDRYSSRVVRCGECDAHRGVVISERIGPAWDRDLHLKPGIPGPVERERLTAELKAVEAKLERQRKSTTATQTRIDEIRAQLGGGTDS